MATTPSMQSTEPAPANITSSPTSNMTETSSSSASIASSGHHSRHSSHTSVSHPPTPELSPKQKAQDTVSPFEVDPINDEQVPQGDLKQREGSDATITPATLGHSPQDLAQPNRSIIRNTSKRLRSRNWMSLHQWFTNSLGIITLTFTLVGLFIFGYRSYKLDIYNSHMSYRQICQGQIQVSTSLGHDGSLRVAW